VALLETGLSGMAGVSAMLAGSAAGALATAEPSVATDVTTDVVPVERLVYRGRAALERALAVRDLLRASPSAPDPMLLDELYALLDLAALD
jgi:hypothetical protein